MLFTLCNFRRLFGTSLTSEWGGRTYQFRALPMGLYVSPFILQNLLNTIVGIVRECTTVHTWGHIDDILLWHNSKATLHEGIVQLFRILHEAGFFIALNKSCLIPTHSINFLGFKLNMLTFDFNCQAPFLQKVRSLLKSIPRSTKQKQRLDGTLAFLFFAMGLTSGYRFASRSIKGRKFLWNLLRSGPWPLPRPPERMWACDATLSCLAAVNHLDQPVFVVQGEWDTIYAAESTALWLAINKAPVATAIFCDNQAAIGALRRTRVKSWRILQSSWLVLHKNLKVNYIHMSMNPADRWTHRSFPRLAP